MPGGPICFQRPARILEPAAGTLSSSLPRVSQPQERAAGKCPAAHRAQNRLEFKQLSPGVSSLFAAALWSLKSSTMPEIVGLLPGRHRGRSSESAILREAGLRSRASSP